MQILPCGGRQNYLIVLSLFTLGEIGQLHINDGTLVWGVTVLSKDTLVWDQPGPGIKSATLLLSPSVQHKGITSEAIFVNIL